MTEEHCMLWGKEILTLSTISCKIDRTFKQPIVNYFYNMDTKMLEMMTLNHWKDNAMLKRGKTRN